MPTVCACASYSKCVIWLAISDRFGKIEANVETKSNVKNTFI